jgi:ribosomal-protein-alanine N-acetyltransferase
MNISDKVLTDRFTLKILQEENASLEYLHWFDDQDIQKFIHYANSKQTVESLKIFIKEKLKQEDCLFFGIFENISNQHIGNIKFEPISSEKNISVMGILIGEKKWRGKNVASEVILKCGEFIKQKFNITQMELGVHKDNLPAIRAYEKMGFNIIKQDIDSIPSNSIFVMRKEV